MIKRILQYLGVNRISEEKSEEEHVYEVLKCVNTNFDTIEKMLNENTLDVIVYLADTAWHSWSEMSYSQYVKVYDTVRNEFRNLDRRMNARVYFHRVNFHPDEVEEYSNILDLSLKKVQNLHYTIHNDVMFSSNIENLHEDTSVVKICVLPVKDNEVNKEGGVIFPRETESGRAVSDYIILKRNNLEADEILHYLGHICGLPHVQDKNDVMFSLHAGCPSKIHSGKFGRESKMMWGMIKKTLTGHNR